MKLALLICLAEDRRSGITATELQPLDECKNVFKAMCAQGKTPCPGYPVLEVWTAAGGRIKSKKLADVPKPPVAPAAKEPSAEEAAAAEAAAAEAAAKTAAEEAAAAEAAAAEAAPLEAAEAAEPESVTEAVEAAKKGKGKGGKNEPPPDL